jgi:hypothetical protein
MLQLAANASHSCRFLKLSYPWKALYTPRMALRYSSIIFRDHHAVTVCLGRHRNGVIAVVPGSISEAFILANPKIKVGSQHTEAMVEPESRADRRYVFQL